MHFLTQTPNGILQSNPVICWGMQDLKNTTKIPSTFLLSRAGLEQQQHYGYFYSLSINTWAFAQCLTCSPTAEHTTCWVHFWTGEKRATAVFTTGMAVLQESSAQFSEIRKKNPNHRSQIKWWCFSWEQHTQVHLQDRKFHVSLL